MLEVFVALILIVFFGLFLVMALPMKDEADKLNKQSQSKEKSSHWQQSR